eukprot:XP_001691574.1 predicted protein [Chlamydomonas reinhardtii]
MPPRARRGAQAPVPARQLSGTAARVHALVIQLAKQGEADGHSLLSVSKSAASELERLLADDEFSATGGHLDALGTLEFWASVCAVHVYALHDYCALYQEMQQLLDRQAHQRTEAAQQDHTEEDEEEETPQVQRLARLLERQTLNVVHRLFNSGRTSVLMFGICGIVASSDALSHNSPGHERRVLALLRSDTFKSYSAVFDAVTRGRRLPRSQADTTVLACGSLMVLMSSCTGIHNVPCHSNADCNLQLYSEFIKAAADSHVIDHACRAAMRFHVSATREQQGCDAIGVTTLKPADRARRLAVVAGLRQPLDYMRRNLNMMIYKLAASLVAPPQPGTDPALLALLPAVRGLLSGTGVQMWAAKQLLDAAHMVEKAAASELGIAAAADDAGSDSFLGLPLAARTSPAVLAEPKDAAGPSGSGQLQRPRMEHATVALHLSTTAASALWQLTMSGPACSLVCKVLAMALPGQRSCAQQGDAHCHDSMALAMATVCRLVKELRVKEAERIMCRVWANASAWLPGLAPGALEAARTMLPSLGSLLLHEYAGEGEAQGVKAGGSQAFELSCPLALRTAIRAGFLTALSRAIHGCMRDVEAGVSARGAPMLVEFLLRQSCALPALLTHGPEHEVVRLVESLRVAAAVLPDQRAMRGGRSNECVHSYRALVVALVQLLEHVTAPVPDDLAAAIDGAAALLTKSSREDVPPQRLRRMWLAARVNGASASRRDTLYVLLLSRLLPTLSHMHLQDLSRPDIPADVVTGLTRVYSAAAMQALMARLVMYGTLGVNVGVASARLQSWLMLLVQDGEMSDWLVAALVGATRRRCPEGTAAALDLLEVLTLLTPAQQMPELVQLQMGKAGTRPPSGEEPPVLLGTAWLRQQGRVELVDALLEAGCHVSSGTDGSRSSSSSSDSLTCNFIGSALMRLVADKLKLRSLPLELSPGQAVWDLAAKFGIRLCAWSDCRQVEHQGQLSACARCRAARYCSSECQKAHWKAGHKTQCPSLGAIWAALNTAPAPLNP